jgi:hypothetical protein
MDSLSTEIFGGAQFFISIPSNSNVVTTRVPGMGQLGDSMSQQNIRRRLPTFLQGVELLLLNPWPTELTPNL